MTEKQVGQLSPLLISVLLVLSWWYTGDTISGISFDGSQRSGKAVGQAQPVTSIQVLSPLVLDTL